MFRAILGFISVSVGLVALLLVQRGSINTISTTSDIKNIIILGAGGNLGSVAVPEIVASGAFNVTILSRESSKSTFPTGVKVIKSNYSDDSLKAAFAGQDAVISLVGSAGFSEQQRIVDAAIAAGVKRFIPSEFGSNTADDRVQKLVPVFVGKRKVVEYLVSKEKEISWTALLTGFFGDWTLRNGFAGFHVKSNTADIYDNGNVPVSFTTLAHVGRALVKVLQQPDKTANQYVYVESWEATQNDILAVFEKVGGAKWTIVKKDSKTTLEESTKKVQSGDFSGVGGLIVGAAYGEWPEGPTAAWSKIPGGSWNSRLGLEKESLEEVVKQVLKK